MIYLKEGNTPLNEAWADEIYQEGNSTYQLTFKYPLNNDKWKLLTEETKLISDDLDGEQEFTIFEVVKEQGYITVYANQVMTLLNYYSISSINVDRVAGNVVMTALAGAILRDCPFSFYSDITDKHTFNAANISVMDALIKEKHSIVGQWGGDLVRDKYQVSLLKNGGSETEALFMYKKNMRSPQQTTSTKELRTRIHFRKKIEVGEGDSKKEQWLRVTVDSPLINKYKHIYEADMEVTDEDVKDLASLTKYGEQYYRTTLCDMIEDSLELDVAGIGDVPVKIFDVVSVYHEQFGIDVRKKITKYRYSPMGKRLKSVGFGTIQQTLGGALNAMVSDSVKAETAIIEQDFEVKLEKELKNADKVFDQKMNQMEQSLSDEIEQARAKAEEVKAAMTDQLNLKINQSKSEITDRLQKEFNQKLSSASADLAGVRANLTQAQSRLSGDISQIQSDIAAIRGKQSQADSELAKQAQSINQAKSELAGVKTNLTQAQSQLNSNIAQIRSDVGNIRTKQTQAESEIAKQVQALNATKTELAGVKSAQATFEQSTTRRLAELTNLADGKASKSEVKQTADELASRIANVQVGGTNLYALSKNSDIWKGGHVADFKMDISSGEISFKATGLDPYVGEATTHPKTVSNRNGVRIPVIAGKSIYVTILNPIFSKNFISYFDENGNTVKHYQYYNTNSFVISPKELTGVSFVTLRFGCGGSNFEVGDVLKTKVKVEYGTIPTDWSPAYEDQDERVSAVESSFKQRADSLEAGVNRLTEGLKTKADSSALTVLSDSIKQSVKSLETNTQNQLDSKLSTTEFDVRASGIRQEILNATKDKADKTLVTAEAGQLREEMASLQVGENLFINSEFKNLRDSGQRYTANGKTYQNMIAPYWYNPYNAGIPNAQNIQHGYFDTETFSDTVFAFNESDGSRHWKALSTDFKIGVIAAGEYYFSADLYATDLGTHIKFGFYYHNSTGKLNFYAGQTKIEVTEKGRWVRLGSPLKVNDDIDLTKKVQFYIYGYNFSTNSILYLKKPKVSKGRLKSDWSPALEDTEGLITEAKATFERTAQGLRIDLSAVQAYVAADGTRSEALRTFSREETARQLTAERKLIEAGYVGIAQHTEDVRSISRRFEELTVGGRNLMGAFNTKPVRSIFDRETYKFTAKTTQNTTRPTLMLQFRWADGSYSAVVSISETGQFARKFKITKPYSELRVKFNCNKEDAVLLFIGKQFIEQNTDYYFTGDLINLSPNDSQADFLKIEKATITSDWSPAPEDATAYADTKLAEFRQSIDGQLATVQAALNTANSSLTNFNSWKQSAQETLNKVGRVEASLNETKTSLAEFRQTAQGLRTDLSAVQAYVNADNTRAEALRTYSREETARQLTAERKLIEAGYVGKATYTEDVKGISRRFEELKNNSDTKLAEFKQGIDGQFATMSSQIGESLKKTDISITPGQIVLGTGKVVNGQTLASLFVQNPESMQAITKLMRITGDLIVDGSITGRDLAAGAITTPHIAAGAVTAEVLGANAVTADKVKADDALLEKLSAGEALLKKLMAKDAFVNRLQSIDFTAEQVKGGMIKALNGALKIDLNNGQYNVMTDQAAIRRVLNGYPNQFLKFTSETEGGAPASVTVLGANRDGTENSKNDSFAGIRLFSGNKVERTEIISDVVRFATGAVNYRGWEMRTLYGNDNRQVILQPFGNVTRSNIVANYFNGIDLVNVLETLNQMMANLGNHTGRHDIFGPIRGLGARKYMR
ncbi:phage tail spike protein [Streptococcus sp. Marseille-P7375]|uniref:phage tail spike protein n=1 Tax=Streptococcus sp. Marseille-P7375 TaxID=2487318 RepID=UPI0011E6A6FB|nr:phage tail spike protein [Streptococcus sp. Marseille-P7375]